ncbi:MAG: PmoA family protein [Bacteroidota bacterium]
MLHKPCSGVLILITLILPACNANSGKIASLEVILPDKTSAVYVPLSVNLDEITYLSDSLLDLYEIRCNSRQSVIFQVEPGNPRMLHWIAESEKGTSGKLTYELVRENNDRKSEIIATVRDSALLIHKGGQNLLQYYFKTVYPPPGVDTAYKRSGFIHPLWAPRGQVLTRIQPPDHYHHYGIWNPWTQVLFEGDTIDFWNINSKQGTVRFAKFISVKSGAVFSEFKVLHEHIVFKKNNEEKTALNELQSVKVYHPSGNQDIFIVEFNIQLNCAGDSPVKILEYHYAGLGWRTTEKWDRYNSMVLTSEGKTRKDADGTKARWCIVQGEIDGDYAGVQMMSFPENYNFPEPLRIWPEDQYGRGDMFANFCPTKNMDWTLYPNKNYMLKYRFVVYNGHLDMKKAENAWVNYAYPPKINIRKFKLPQ